MSGDMNNYSRENFEKEKFLIYFILSFSIMFSVLVFIFWIPKNSHESEIINNTNIKKDESYEQHPFLKKFSDPNGAMNDPLSWKWY